MRSKLFLPVTISLFLAASFSCHRTTDLPAGTEPDDPQKFNPASWAVVDDGLNGGFGSTDYRYSRSTPPKTEITSGKEIAGWRGERLNLQMVFWSRSAEGVVTITPGDLKSDNNVIPSSFIKAMTVKYLLADEFLDGCGYRDKDTIPVHLTPDLLDNNSEFELRGNELRPVWITVDLPYNAVPGVYKSEITACSGNDTIITSLSVTVQDMLLPSPDRWRFHLDLWQNPYAVARYHNVQPWSQEHLDLLRPLLEMLAEAGQKCITTTINDRPWGGQTEDPFGSMITWIRNSDGLWDYDYSLFDQYVSLAMECGITGQINCYSLVPWGNRITWLDEDSAKFVTTEVIPGTSKYEDYWRPFLQDFKVHLLEMGWFDRAFLALDERNEDDMKNMFSFISTAAPGFKIAMAGNYFKSINSQIDDFSFNNGIVDNESGIIADRRRSEGKVTTYYVCCSDPMPNNFTFSPPAESCYQGWFAAAMGFDGFLRWAYNSWPKDPVYDSRFRTWPSGDTYLVYPGARSSVRFERLREGIQDYEKIRILKDMLSSDPSMEAERAEKLLSDFLGTIDSGSLKTRSASEITAEGKMIIDNITSAITRK